jgi:Collagen triple helix repeat (20 copies)
MKSAIIAATTAAIISAGATTAATTWINGAEIRPHSISASKLTPQAVRSLRGQRGPRGYQGAQGLQGPQGVQGLRGVQGLQGARGPIGPSGAAGPPGQDGGFDPNKLLLYGVADSIAPFDTKAVRAYCPFTNMIPISGGFERGPTDVLSSTTFTPSALGGAGYQEVTFHNTVGSTVQVTVSVVCASP